MSQNKIIKVKIANETIPDIYEISKKVYEKKLDYKEGANLLFEKNKLNINSAKDYIYNFKYLMEGKAFKRTLNAYSMEYFIASIKKDYSNDQFNKALSTLEGHILYYESCHSSPLYKLRSILKKYSQP